MRKTRGILALTITCALLSINTWAKDNAVILLYHHVSNSTPKVTSVSPETFREHMQYLAEHFQVLFMTMLILFLKNFHSPIPFLLTPRLLVMLIINLIGNKLN
jgi:hypothetical protein